MTTRAFEFSATVTRCQNAINTANAVAGSLLLQSRGYRSTSESAML